MTPLAAQGTLELLPGIHACPGGAVWLPSLSALLVADVHLGYAWAQRRRGALGPLTTGGVEQRLERLLDWFAPRRLVVLGDLVHAPRPSPAEREVILTALARWSAGAAITLVRGNHDRGLERDFPSLPVECVKAWQAPGVVAVHGDSPAFAWPEDAVALLGHWHPCAAVRDRAGVHHRYPAFLVWPRAVVLPAFSPLAAGVRVDRLPAELLAVARRPAVPPGIALSSVRRVVWLRPPAPEVLPQHPSAPSTREDLP